MSRSGSRRDSRERGAPLDRARRGNRTPPPESRRARPRRCRPDAAIRSCADECGPRGEPLAHGGSARFGPGHDRIATARPARAARTSDRRLLIDSFARERARLRSVMRKQLLYRAREAAVLWIPSRSRPRASDARNAFSGLTAELSALGATSPLPVRLPFAASTRCGLRLYGPASRRRRVVLRLGALAALAIRGTAFLLQLFKSAIPKGMPSRSRGAPGRACSACSCWARDLAAPRRRDRVAKSLVLLRARRRARTPLVLASIGDRRRCSSRPGAAFAIAAVGFRADSLARLSRASAAAPPRDSTEPERVDAYLRWREPARSGRAAAWRR